MQDNGRTPTARGSSVQQDWRAWLSEEKTLVFQKNEQHLESLYHMFSVALNEAIEIKQLGCLTKALPTVGMTADLCGFLIRPLVGMLRALREHARHYGIVPNAAPLDPANYRGQRGQRCARMSGLLNRVLFSQRIQFLQKVSTIEELVEDLGKDFRSVAAELADGLSTDPEHGWAELDAVHYDLNTCLCETLILYKSFMVVLPAGQLQAFQRTVREQWQEPERALPVVQPAPQPRRAAAFAAK
ncbi:MAG TPA: hypothetical protein VEI73_10990 [Candidatus Acidoferrum sp.]|nr:hypothetical protein [Candidatus Acidoferrum sp.]